MAKWHSHRSDKDLAKTLRNQMIDQAEADRGGRALTADETKRYSKMADEAAKEINDQARRSAGN
jgi:hypothetical protein